MREEWCARELAGHGAEDAESAWRDSVCATHLAWALDRVRPTSAPDSAARVRARIHRYRLGDIDLVQCWTPPCSGRRRRTQISATDGDYVGVLAVVSGRELLRIGEHDCAVAAGELVVWLSGVPVEFVVPGPLVKRTLLVPRARFLEVTARPEALAGTVLAGGPAATLFTTYLNLLTRSDLAPDTAPSAGSAALDLLGGLAARAAADSRRPASHGALLAAAKAHIEAHLGEPALTAQAVAAAVAVSPRLLYALFEEEGDAVHAYVRRRRLARARAELTPAGTARPTIAAVAARTGFTSADALAKAYRKQYGVSPGRARRDGSPAEQDVQVASTPA